MRANEVETADKQELAEAKVTLFDLERDFQRALRANIIQIEPGLKTIDGGTERTVPSGGRIDILAEDSAGTTVVIELKVGTADRGAVAQLIQYMGDISETAPTVRGIVVAGDFAPSAIAAARMVPRVRLLKYSYKFSFGPVTA
jgi:RecB family endonuclease NucS